MFVSLRVRPGRIRDSVVLKNVIQVAGWPEDQRRWRVVILGIFASVLCASRQPHDQVCSASKGGRIPSRCSARPPTTPHQRRTSGLRIASTTFPVADRIRIAVGRDAVGSGGKNNAITSPLFALIRFARSPTGRADIARSLATPSSRAGPLPACATKRRRSVKLTLRWRASSMTAPGRAHR